MKRLTGYGSMALVVFGLALWLPHRPATAGELFMTDWSGTYGGSSIQQISPSGSASVFYNSGLWGANCLAFNSSGNLFQSDSDSGKIYEYTPSGNQTTFASGMEFPRGLAFDASGNLYVADVDTGQIDKFTPSGQSSVFASGLSNPETMAFDSNGNLFVADGNSTNAIIEFTPSGGSRSTFASTGFTQLNGSIAFGPGGNLFVGDSGAGAIYEFTPGGQRSTFVSGIVPVNIGCMTFDAAGNLFLAGGPSGDIYEFPAGGGESIFASGLPNADGLAFAPTPTPEPGTFVLLAAGALGFAGYVWRRRAKRRTANPTASDQPDAPAILSFPVLSATHATRRAA